MTPLQQKSYPVIDMCFGIRKQNVTATPIRRSIPITLTSNSHRCRAFSHDQRGCQGAYIRISYQNAASVGFALTGRAACARATTCHDATRASSDLLQVSTMHRETTQGSVVKKKKTLLATMHIKLLDCPHQHRSIFTPHTSLLSLQKATLPHPTTS